MVRGPGESGNPAGRTIGSRNRKTLLMEQLLEGNCEELARKMVEKALGGDMTALRLCLERLLPRMRERPVVCPLPTIAKPEDVGAAVAEIQAAVCAGALSPREGMDMLRLVDKVAQTLATAMGVGGKAGQADKYPQRMSFSLLDGTFLSEMERQPDGGYRVTALSRREDKEDNGSNEKTKDQQ
jgi:hypothetical protein